jgi:uncharacterized repeat protein (TIGR01451 family)
MGAEGGRQRRLLVASCLIAATVAAWAGSSGALPVDLVPGSSTTTAPSDTSAPSVVDDRPGTKPSSTTTDTTPTSDPSTTTTEGGEPGSTVDGTTSSSEPGPTTTDPSTGSTGSTTTTGDPGSTSSTSATTPGATTTIPGASTVPDGTTSTTGTDPTDPSASTTEPPTTTSTAAPTTTSTAAPTTTTTAPSAEADLSISIDDGDGEPGDGALPTVVAPGDTYSYTIVVRNEGPGRSTGAEFVATVPPELLVLGATGPSDLRCSVSGTTSRCTLGTVEAGDSVTLIVAVKVLQTTPPGTITALISLVPGQKDLDPSDNTESENTTIVAADQLADVSVVKDDGDGSGNGRRVPAGGAVTYTMRVGNAGPATATGVVVVDQPPPGVTLSDPVAPPGVACAIGDDGALRCVVGTLPKAGMVLIRVTARVGYEVVPGTVVNQAVVSADQPDADHGDNGDAESTVITEPPAADVAIDVTGPALARAGADVPIDATVTNTGPVPLDEIAIDGPRCVDPTVGDRTDVPPVPLEPGQQRTYRCALAAPDAPEVDAEVHVLAVDRAGRSVESRDSVVVDLIAPELTLTAFTDRLELPGPDLLTLTLRVRNAGDAVVRSIVLTDDIFQLRLDAGTLPPGASRDVQQAVFFANTTALTIGATGIDPLDGPVSASSSLRIVVGGTTSTSRSDPGGPPTSASSAPPGGTSPSTATPTTSAPAPPETPSSAPDTTASSAPPPSGAPTSPSSPVTRTTGTAADDGSTTTVGTEGGGGATQGASTAPTEVVEPTTTSSTRPVLQPGPSIGDDEGEPQAIGPAPADGDDGGGVGSAAATVVLGALVGLVLVGLGFTSVNAAIRSRRG